MVVRRPEAGAEIEAAWPGVATFRTLPEMVAALPQLEFLVIA